MKFVRYSFLSLALGLGVTGSIAVLRAAESATSSASVEAVKPVVPAVKLEPFIRESFQPGLPKVVEKEDVVHTQAQVDLGRMLYYENRLSKNHDISCNSCHQLDKYGVDGEATSPGHRKQRGERNSPSVYNAAGHVAQFWDGRAEDVEEQAKGPILNAIEMGMPDQGFVVRTLKSIPGYVEAFARAFPGEKDPVTYDNLAAAIGAFERRLLTPGRFDRFLAGDDTVLTDAEKHGLKAFVEVGCIACHNGPYVGARIYQKVGLIRPWPVEEGKTLDVGRQGVTKQGADKHVFKVPSLRNVAKTGPYLHNGSIKELPQMVRLMARHQLGREVTDEQVDAIVAFLKALTGELPTDYIKRPELPASGPDTPKPDPS
jgi:cytochrome c peroxidase